MMSAQEAWSEANAAVVEDYVATEQYMDNSEEKNTKPTPTTNGWHELNCEQRVKELEEENAKMKAQMEEFMKAKDEQVVRINEYDKMMNIKNQENLDLKEHMKTYEEKLAHAEMLREQELEKKIEIEKKLNIEKELQMEKRVKKLVTQFETQDVEKKSEMEKNKLEKDLEKKNELEKKLELEKELERAEKIKQMFLAAAAADGPTRALRDVGADEARGSNDPPPMMKAKPQRPPPPPPPARPPPMMAPGVPIMVKNFNNKRDGRPRQDEPATLDLPWLGLGGGSVGLEVAEHKVTQDMFMHMLEQMQEYLGGEMHQTSGGDGGNYFEGHLDQHRVKNSKGVDVTLTVLLMLKDAGKTMTNSETYGAYKAKILMRGVSTKMMKDETFKEMMMFLARAMWAGYSLR
jgi:hypothetical protein